MSASRLFSLLALSTRLNGRITALRGIATKWTRWAEAFRYQNVGRCAQTSLPTKNALRETFPYGLFESLNDIVSACLFGHHGPKPIVVGYDRGDMDLWANCIMRLVQMAGVVPSDRVQMAFGYGMFTGGILALWPAAPWLHDSLRVRAIPSVRFG